MRPSPRVLLGSSIPPRYSRSPAAPTEEVSHMSVLPTRADSGGRDRHRWHGQIVGSRKGAWQLRVAASMVPAEVGSATGGFMFNLLGEGVIFYFDMTSNLERSCKNSPQKTHIQIHQQFAFCPSGVCVCAFPPPLPASNISNWIPDADLMPLHL